MKKILIIAYPPVDKDPRPKRQISWLKNEFIIHSLSTKSNGNEDKFIEIKKPSFKEELIRLPLLLFRQYNLFYWDKHKKKLIKNTEFDKYDLIIVHEIRLVPLAIKISKGAKIILDAHEFSPENFADNLLWKKTYGKYYDWLCRQYLHLCTDIITVSKGIANLYKKNFNILPKVILNTPEYLEINPKAVNPSHIKILHHGNCSASRKIEVMIEAAKEFNDNFHLYLMLVVSKSSQRYYDKLQLKAKGIKNIHFLPPVPSANLVSFSNQFDIGIAFFPPVNLNLKYALPNKFFEYIQSRLCIICGPDKEMSDYLTKYQLGKVTSDFSSASLIKTVNNLTSEVIMNYKTNSHLNANFLSSNNEKQIFKELVNKILTC